VKGKSEELKVCQMGKPKADRLSVAVLAGIGGLLGLLVAITLSASGPTGWDPVQVVVTHTDPPIPGVDGVAKVILFDKWSFTLSAPRREASSVLFELLSLLPQMAVITIGMGLGWWCGVLLNRRRDQEMP
jgi:hypothetical protein